MEQNFSSQLVIFLYQIQNDKFNKINKYEKQLAIIVREKEDYETKKTYTSVLWSSTILFSSSDVWFAKKRNSVTYPTEWRLGS